MRITYPSLLALALTVASCGGGGSGTPTSTAGQSSTGSTSGQATDTGAGTSGSTNTNTSGNTGSTTGTTTPTPAVSGLIEYYGDSTIYGYMTNSEQGGAEPRRVDTPAPETFRRKLDASRFPVVNKGINGTAACELLNGGTSAQRDSWNTQMSSSVAKYVIINHGINDYIRETPVAQYRGCLEQLADRAKAAGKIVIFETPNPIVPVQRVNENFENYVITMRSVATSKAIPVIDQYAFLKDYLRGANASVICPDGLHPSQDVYTMKGEFAAAEFKRFFP
jgi:hypothetical protein